jgi:iron complex transport system substrate-binding protein
MVSGYFLMIWRRTLLLGALVMVMACGVRPPRVVEATPTRIVSMAPSLTETLMALDLEDRIVGVTRYCPDVAGAEVVGGYFDPNFEAIVALGPDLIVLMQSHDELRRRFDVLGLDTLQVDQHDVAGVLGSVLAIADRCGVGGRGLEVVTELEAKLAEVSAVVAEVDRPRVLVVVGREPGDGRIGSLWAAGNDTFYDDVLRIGGGVNVIRTGGIRYPELSREGILALDPDVILDVVADGGARGLERDVVAADWREFEDLRAVRSGRVYVLLDDFVVIPGPRIVDTVGRVARLLHPEARWP